MLTNHRPTMMNTARFDEYSAADKCNNCDQPDPTAKVGRESKERKRADNGRGGDLCSHDSDTMFEKEE
jgi:hypothetical protein